MAICKYCYNSKDCLFTFTSVIFSLLQDQISLRRRQSKSPLSIMYKTFRSRVTSPASTHARSDDRESTKNSIDPRNKTRTFRHTKKMGLKSWT